MKRIVIFGGTGFIGSYLAQYIADRGMEPIIIARHPPKKSSSYRFISWDARTVSEWKDELEGAYAIVNLAGKSVDCIKTPDNADIILRSRVESTKAIGMALRQLKVRPKVWIQMSTAHIYGDPPRVLCTESSSTGYGLAPEVGKAWESTFLEMLPKEMRGLRLRTSFVIGANGGAMKQLRLLTMMGFGARVGHGRQGLSWIHQIDLCKLIYESLMNENYSGILVASSPHPVSQNLFMKTLRTVMHIPIGIPTPALLARIGAHLFFRSDPDLILYGRYVKSEKLGSLGFKFDYPELSNALKHT